MCSEEEGCTLVIALPKSKLCIFKNSDHQEATDSTRFARQGSIAVSMECRNHKKPKRKDDVEDKIEEEIEDESEYKFDIDIKGMCVEEDLRYPGGIMEKKEDVTSLSECKELCSEEPDCVRIDVDPKSGMCLLKSDSHGSPVRRKGLLSVSMDCRKDRKEKEADKSKKTVPEEADDMDEGDISEECLERGVDYPGGTTRNLPGVKSVWQCRNLCLHHDQCVRLVFIPKMKRCLLKNEKHGPVSKKTRAASSGSVSFAIDSPYCQPGRDKFDHRDFLDVDEAIMERNRDYPGGTISTIDKVETMSSCLELCKKNVDCVRIIVNMRNYKCVLKSDQHEDGVFKKDVISVALKWEEAGESGACFRRNIDFPGGDIKRIEEVQGPVKCALICKFTKNCKRIVWVPYEKSCILKNKQHGPATHQSLIANREAISVSLACRQEKRMGRQEKLKPDRKDNEEPKEKSVSKFINLDGKDVQLSTSYPGGLLTTLKNVPLLSKCQKSCSENSACVLVVANIQLRRCFLRNEKHGKAKKQKGFVSVIVRKPDSEKKKSSNDEEKAEKSEKTDPSEIKDFEIDLTGPCIETNVDYPQGIIAKFDEVSSIIECRDLCKKRKDCVRFIILASKRRCLLKNSDHESSTTEGWVTKQNSYSACIECLENEENENEKKRNDREKDEREKEDNRETDEREKGGKNKFKNDLQKDPCVEEERTVSGKTLKRLSGIDKASDSSVRVRNERAEGLLLGKLNCELDKEETEEDVECIKRNADYPKGILSEVEDMMSVFSCHKECERTNECAAYTFIPKKKLCVFERTLICPCQR
ncbi:micronemal protein 4-like [Bolinopsis microptera]|uniref:micronemal protein 4-like n=1 Tax=Bolinopsis microptera TaxID=2820187 RepID=UPI00307A9AE4